MIATAKTPGGILVPLTLNQFEFRRRMEHVKKKFRKEEALRQLRDSHDIEAKRGSYMLRNFGVDGILKMDRLAKEERRQRERVEAERIADMMAMEAASALNKGLI